MSTLSKAIAIAAAAHEGQVDKGGAPYILHPLRVMMAVKGEHAKMAAVLHDVVEDTSVTIKDLADAGFPDAVVKAVIYLTKLPEMSHMETAKMAALDPISLEVKMADARDNMDLTRIPSPTEKDHKRAAEYQKVYFYLASHKEAA